MRQLVVFLTFIVLSLGGFSDAWAEGKLTLSLVNTSEPATPAVPTGPAIVIYPESQEPYASVIAQIIQGISQYTRDEPDIYVLPTKYSSAALQQWLDKNTDSRAIIALTPIAVSALETVHTQLPVFVGAIKEPPKGEVAYQGVSLFFNPRTYLSHLMHLSPNVKTVHWFFDPVHHAEVRSLLHQAANDLNLHLMSHAITSTRQALLQINDVLDSVDPKSEALWIPEEIMRMNEAVMFPFIMKTAWRRQVLVFSNSPIYVKRGFLFALYPDYVGLGQTLARLAHANGHERSRLTQLELLEDAQVAVNLRTARHLELKLSREQLQQFGLVYPAR